MKAEEALKARAPHGDGRRLHGPELDFRGGGLRFDVMGFTYALIPSFLASDSSA